MELVGKSLSSTEMRTRRHSTLFCPSCFIMHRPLECSAVQSVKLFSQSLMAFLSQEFNAGWRDCSNNQVEFSEHFTPLLREAVKIEARNYEMKFYEKFRKDIQPVDKPNEYKLTEWARLAMQQFFESSKSSTGMLLYDLIFISRLAIQLRKPGNDELMNLGVRLIKIYLVRYMRQRSKDVLTALNKVSEEFVAKHKKYVLQSCFNERTLE